MSHFQNMTDLAKRNNNILSPLCGVVFAMMLTFVYVLYSWLDYRIELLTSFVFLFCAASFCFSLYIIFTHQDKTLMFKDMEWKLEKKKDDIRIEQQNLKEREDQVNQKIQWIIDTDKALEQKKEAYVVFDFK